MLLALLAVAAGSLRAPHSRRCVPRRHTLRPLLLRGGDGGDNDTEDCPGGVCKMPGADDDEAEATADADAADGAEVAAADDAAAVEEPPPPTFLQRILPNLMLIGVAIVARLIKHFFLKGRGGAAAEAAAEAVEGAAEGVAAAAGEAVADAAADGAAAAATEAAAEATGLFGRFRAFISGPSAAPLMMSLLVLSTRMVSGLNKQQEAEAAAAEAPVEVEEEVVVEAAADDEDDADVAVDDADEDEDEE